MIWLFLGEPRPSVGVSDQANSDNKSEIAKMTVSMSMSLQGSRADGEEEIKESDDEMMNKAVALSLSLQEQSRREQEKEEEEEILAKTLALSMVEK